MIKPWYELYPGLFQEEIEQMEELGLVLDKAHLEQRSEVKVSGEVKVVEQKFKIEIIFPGGYPWVRPEVYVPEITKASHQEPYRGNLCLLEYYPSKWHADLNSSYIVERAKIWIDNHIRPDADPTKWEDEVDAPEPRQFYTPEIPSTGLLVPEEFLDIPPGSTGTFEARFDLNCRTGVVTGLDYNDGSSQKTRIQPDYSHLYQKKILRAKGFFFSTNSTPPYFETPQDIMKWATEQGIRNLGTKCDKATLLDPLLQRYGYGKLVAIRYLDEGINKGEHVPYWLVYSLPKIWKGLKMPAKKFIVRSYNVRKEQLFNRSAGWEGLRDKNVVVVGLGAIGSYIAVELVRAGVNEMTIIDPDIFDVGNVVRHVLSLEDVGLSKSEAMANHLKKINPFLKVHPLGMRVGIDHKGLEDFAEHVCNADLVISATGENGADRVINEVCLQLGKPAIYAWASIGAWGGTVIRTGPDQGCFDCFCYWDNEPEAPFMPEVPEVDPFYELSCALPTFPGTGFDTGAIAMAATRLAARSLLALDGIPDVVYDWLTISNRGTNKDEDLVIEKRELPSHPLCARHS